MAKTKILLVDDHRIVTEGIKSALRDHPEYEVVGEAVNGREAVQSVIRLKPDIVIMDISMPDLNGIDATLQIRKLDPGVKIIIFTMYSNIEYVIDLFKAGVSGYVLKEDPVTKLIAAVEKVKNGHTAFGMSPATGLFRKVRAAEDGKIADGALRELSLREREIFQLLAEGNAIKTIAKTLGISPKTVESHKYNIMEKLNARTLADLTRIAIRKKIIQL